MSHRSSGGPLDFYEELYASMLAGYLSAHDVLYISVEAGIVVAYGRKPGTFSLAYTVVS